MGAYSVDNFLDMSKNMGVYSVDNLFDTCHINDILICLAKHEVLLWMTILLKVKQITFSSGYPTPLHHMDNCSDVSRRLSQLFCALSIHATEYFVVLILLIAILLSLTWHTGAYTTICTEISVVYGMCFST